MNTDTNLKKIFFKMKKCKTCYVIMIILLFLSGTVFVILGSLEARISEVTLPLEKDAYFSNENETTFMFYLTIEIWNPSFVPRIVRTPNLGFTYDYAFEINFYNDSSPIEYAFWDRVRGEDFLEGYNYIQTIGGIASPTLGTEFLMPGITRDTTMYGLRFYEGNLTKLPEGFYKLYLYLGRRILKTKVDALYLNVSDYGINVSFEENINWGGISIFRSGFSYYLIASVMILIPRIIRKRKHKQENNQ